MEHLHDSNSMPGVVSNLKTRPAFLTVLCICSFVGIGLVIFSAIINLVANPAAISLHILQNSNTHFGNMIENPDEYLSATFINNIVSGISALVCLVGVLMMWSLKKAGFFIYSIAEIVPPIIALALTGKSGFAVQ